MCSGRANLDAVKRHSDVIAKANPLNTEVSQGAFRKLYKASSGMLWWLTDELWSNRMDAAIFDLMGERILTEAHVRAGVLGRNRSGDDRARNSLDQAWGVAAWAEDGYRWQRFASDIRSGRYTDAAGVQMTDAIRARVNMYASKTRGTANQAFANQSGDLTLDWVMLNIENCRDCPRLEAGSPYTKDSLPFHPGTGRTQCLTNCGCVLDREDGAVGFYREFPGESLEPIAPSEDPFNSDDAIVGDSPDAEAEWQAILDDLLVIDVL